MPQPIDLLYRNWARSYCTPPSVLTERRSKALMVVLVAIGGMLLLAPAEAALAAQANSQLFDKCIDRSGGITSAMRDCAGEESSRQDRELNALYKQAMSLRDTTGRERLRMQERAWLKTRTTHCRKVEAQNDGTAALLDLDSCWIELTDKRIAELRALANGRP